jgi:hypothetical protein
VARLQSAASHPDQQRGLPAPAELVLDAGGYEAQFATNYLGTGYDPGLAYAQSKTAAVLFAVELDRRWAELGIRGYAVIKASSSAPC